MKVLSVVPAVTLMDKLALYLHPDAPLDAILEAQKVPNKNEILAASAILWPIL